MRPVLDRVSAPDEATKRLLLSHPSVREAALGRPGVLGFSQDRWNRRVVTGRVHDGPSGLLELIDNNPVVCADEVGIPGPAGTLALIGLGPIVQAGILAEPPTMLTNAPGTPDDLAADLLSIDWSGGITLEREDLDLGGVYAATIIAVIQTPEDLEEIDDVYEERFGRSFFVRREESQEWDVALVKSRPEALYRLRIAPDAPLSLLTIQVMADRDGKCGASQFVHAMNIMCGFEESLGIAG